MEDVADEFSNCELIKKRFETWKSLSPASYRNAYVSLALPRVFMPLVCIELVDWNPLDYNTDDDDNNNNNVFAKLFSWFTQLCAFSLEPIPDVSETSIKQQPQPQQQPKEPSSDDLLIVPRLIERVVLTKLISVTDSVYDPLSISETRAFTRLLSTLIDLFPTLNANSANTKVRISLV